MDETERVGLLAGGQCVAMTDATPGREHTLDALDQETVRQGEIDGAYLSPDEKLEERAKVREELDHQLDGGGRTELKHE